MESTIQDLRLALRAFFRNPGVASVIVVTLALGIGANAAIFSVMNTVILKPLPFPELDRLVTVWTPQTGYSRNPLCDADWIDLRDGSESFEFWGPYLPESFNLSGDEDPERVRGVSVTLGVLEALGIVPSRGRLFTERDMQDPSRSTVIVSERLWKTRYGSDPDLIGRDIRIDGAGRTVIGILREDFRFPGRQALREPDVLLPLYLDETDPERGSYYLSVLGKLREDVSLEAARRELGVIAARLEEAYPETNRDRIVEMYRLREEVLGDSGSRVWTLLGIAGIVLLIACTNVASVLLGRNAARNAEMAVRISLGAGRGRLVRQLLTESLVFSIVGGTAGLLFAWWGIGLLRGTTSANMPRIADVQIDMAVVLFTYCVAVLTGVLFGILPALTTSRTNLTSNLGQQSRTVAMSRSQSRFLGILIVCQFALTFVLANGAGLMVRSLWNATDSRELRQPRQALLAGYMTPREESDEIITPDPFLDRLLERLRGMPGVSSAGATSRLPLLGGWTAGVLSDRQEYDSNVDRGYVNVICATPEYIDAVGMTLLQGRDLTNEDLDAGNLGVLVNRTLASSFWPGEDPVGRQVRSNSSTPWFEASVVGVIEDVRQEGLERPASASVYVPFFPPFQADRWVVLRAEGDPHGLVAGLREQLAVLDPHLPLTRVLTGTELYDLLAEDRRFTTRLIGLFALVALCLVAAGTYGVMAFLVRRRAHEMGIRAALGANRTDVLRMVFGRSLQLASAGMVLGLLAAVLTSRVVGNLLFGVGPLNPVFLAGAAVFMLSVAIIAASVPALRAARVDPVEVMRAE
jgi:predicted permease